jgi:surfactin synthase thioesterase subunit
MGIVDPTDDYAWMKNSKRHYVRDLIDGGHVLRNESRDRLWKWCEQNCKGRYWIGMGFGTFELDEDAILFNMVWG